MKKIIQKIKSLDKGTIIRTIMIVLAYVNQIVALIGQTSFASSPVYQWITFGVTVVTTLIGYWYNNDWSNFAMLCTDIFEMLRDGKITSEEVEKFIKKHSKKKEEKPIEPAPVEEVTDDNV